MLPPNRDIGNVMNGLENNLNDYRYLLDSSLNFLSSLTEDP